MRIPDPSITVELLAAFRDDLDMTWLEEELKSEDSLDALHALQRLAQSNEPVTEDVLRQVIDDVRRHGPTR